MALTQISTAGVKDDIVTAAKIADDAVTEALISDDSVDEARLKISNAGSNGQALTKQSGNTGGLTWATISGGISDIVSDTSPQLGGDLDTNSFEILLDDDHNIKFGASNDLTIHHAGAGANKIISASPHTLYIASDQTQITNAGISEACGKFIANGAVELYYDNSKKFETKSDGALVDGDLWINTGGTIKTNSSQGQLTIKGGATYPGGAIKFAGGQDGATDQGTSIFYAGEATSLEERLRITKDGKVRVPDSGKFVAGAGDDLQIYHDGTNSYITNATGNLYIKQGADTILLGVQNGATSLRYDGSTKFETASDGVHVTGHLGFDDNGRIQCGAGDDLHIYHDGSNTSYIKETTANLNIEVPGGSNVVRIKQTSGGEAMAQFIASGSCELYYDNTKKFETTAAGCKVSTGVLDFDDSVEARFGTGNDLKIYHDGNNSFIDDAGTGGLYIRANIWEVQGTPGSGEEMIEATVNAAVKLFYDNVKKFETSAAGINLDNSGGTAGVGKITFGNSGLQYIEGKDSGNFGSGAYITIGSGTDVAIKAKHDGAVELYHNNAKKAETTSYGFLITETGGTGGTGAKLQFEANNTDPYKYIMQSSYWVETGIHNNQGARWRESDGDVRMTLEGSSGNLWISGSYSSDRNLKENIEDITINGIDLIKQVKPKTFTFKFDSQKKTKGGFIAQEMQELLPKLVHGTTYDESKTDSGSEAHHSKGNPTGLGFDYHGYTAYLTKALQEAITKIETLETKVAALEAG